VGETLLAEAKLPLKPLTEGGFALTEGGFALTEGGFALTEGGFALTIFK
jgi:hypothetical protein